MTLQVPTRWASVQAGDSLRTIALRELGDALRWGELATINQLRPPYIIASVDSADRQRATLLWGDQIAVPLGAIAATVQLPVDVLGVDVTLPQGRLTAAAAGDWATCSGDANLRQALAHRLKTPTGDLLAHPAYGCDTDRLLGLRHRPVLQVLMIRAIRLAIAQEPRIARAEVVKTAMAGEHLFAQVSVLPVDRNSPTDLNLVFPLG